MDRFMMALAILAGVLSATSSFGVIFALHRVETLIEKAIEKFDDEKNEAGDTLMAIANVLQERGKK